jgi:SAM-dependent methyltransferase
VKRVALVFVVLLSVATLTLPAWKPAAKRFKWFVVATNIYQDTLRRTGIRNDQIGQTDYGALPVTAVPAYLNRINSTFADYVKYGGLDDRRVRGARVLEIGPGETVGVAIRFLAAGAAQVTANDKFVPLQRSPFHERLYRALVGSMPEAQQQDAASAVRFDRGVNFDEHRLQYIYGEGIEDAAATLPSGAFDVIVSNAVIEEIYDVDRMFDTLDRLLGPGGRQVHVIDLGDYGMLSKHGFHPLEFLTLPDPIYRYMVESTGQPNRRPLAYYRDKLRALGYSTTIYRTWVLGEPARLPEYRHSLEHGRDYTDAHLRLVSSIRGRLLPRYRQLPDEELLTRSILVVAEKPVRVPLSASRHGAGR